MQLEAVEGFRLSPQQERLVLAAGSSDSGPFLTWCAVRVTGSLDLARLQRALGRVVARHEILRTVFRRLPGMTLPLQVIREPAQWFELHHEQAAATLAPTRGLDLETGDPSRLARPYDLDHEPALRLRWLDAGSEHRLLLCVPALVCDRLGMRNLVAEIAHACSERPGWAEEPIQYADCAEALNTLGESPEAEEGRAFWRQAAEPELRFGDAGAAPFAPETRAHRLSPELRGRCGAAAERLGVPLQAFFLSCWQVLLWRLLGGDGMVVDTSFHGRVFADLETAVGLFARDLPVACTLAPARPLAEIARQLALRLEAAQAHQDAFVDPPRNDGYREVCGFEMVSAPARIEVEGRVFTIEREHVGLERRPMQLILTLGGDGLLAELCCDAGRLPAPEQQRWLERFVCLVEAASRDPRQPIESFGLIGEVERRQLLEELNQTAVPLPQPALLHRAFELRAQEHGERLALVCEERHLSYAALEAAANRWAHQLIATGVSPGTLVAIAIERSPEMVIALLAVLKTGAAYLPLDPEYPPERLAAMREDARSPVLLTTRAHAAGLTGEGVRAVVLDDPATQSALAARPPLRPRVEPLAAAPAYVIYTSGSSGRPKGVMVGHRAICNRVTWMARALPLAPDDRVLHKTPLSFDASIWELFAPLGEGATVVLARSGGHHDTAYLGGLLARQRIGVAQMVPPQLRVLLESTTLTSSALRRMFCGGDVLDGELRDRFFARFPHAELHNLYGPTETAIDATSWRCGRRDPDPVVAIGRALDNVRVYLLDRRAQPVAWGAVGEIHVGGVGLAVGYLRRPAATAERFVPDPFTGTAGARLYATGDLGRLRTDGALLFLGRGDHQVKIRGVRLEPAEIEAALLAHPQVASAVVTARVAAGGEKRLVAHLVPRGGGLPAVEQLRAHLRRLLPEQAIPSELFALDRLPLLPNGKLDRRALQAAERRHEPTASAGAGVFLEPTEELLAQVWADVLGVERVAPGDDFFALGGHSLVATKLASRLRQVMGVEVGLRELFDHPTLSRQAALIDRRRRVAPAQPERIERVPRGAELPLSFAQQRLWFLDQWDPANPAYNIPVAVQLSGELRVPALVAACGEVVRRHETLRATFAAVRGLPTQTIAAVAGVAVAVVDLSGLGAETGDAEQRRRSRAEARLPFDLGRGPLIRFGLLRRAAREHVLLVTMHHIVGDAWSSTVLAREIATLYAAFAAGLSSPLPELPLQYADFAAWQHRWLQGEVLETQLRYWRQQLAGAPTVLELPSDHRRPETPGRGGAHQYLRVSAERSSALGAFNRRHGVTTFMTLMAVYQLLLAHLTGRDDVVVGTDVANRHRLETEGLIGFFINQLVIRTNLAGDPTFVELLSRVRSVALDAYAHQDLPFERLVDLLGLDRSLSAAPLFQTKLFFVNVPSVELQLPELSVRLLETDSDAAKLDLTLAFWETRDGLNGWASYRTDLFDPATITRILSQLDTLLDLATARPEMRITELMRLLESAEREKRQMDTKQRHRVEFSKLKGIKPKAQSLSAEEVVTKGYLEPGETLPLVIRPAVEDVDLVEWCTDNRAAIESDLLRHGAILFRGFRITTDELFERVAASMCDQLFNENGEHPRESVSGNVYTPVFFPPDQKLLWHNENSFNKRWPRKIIFCCVQPAEQGGETPLVDSRKVYQQLPEALRQRFEQRGVRYCRTYGTGLGLNWQDVFQTDDRAQAEAKGQTDGMEIEWLSGDRVHTEAWRPAVIAHPVTGEMSWFNQAQHWHVACLDPETRRSMEALFPEGELPRSCYYGDRSPITDEDMEHVLEVYRRLEISFPWQQGDVLVVDNVLAAHGRNAFSGRRKLLVALGDMASFDEAHTTKDEGAR